MRELKHVICCYGSTRPVRKTIDDYGSQVMIGTGSAPSGMNGSVPYMPTSGSYDDGTDDPGRDGNGGQYFPATNNQGTKQGY